jgi:DNA modification methylase
LEPTPEEYVERIVEVFREVRRVLRGDGTLWLNLGDSYAANRSYQVSDSKHAAHDFGGSNAQTVPPGLKPKDLVGIPWMVAFALRADGWYLRSDIIWAKPNPMPESVTDRPTKAHEYLFLLSKSPRYFYDAASVREENSASTVERHSGGRQTMKKHKHSDEFDHKGTLWANDNNRAINGRNRRSVWTIATQPYAGAHFATFPPALVAPCILAGTSARGVCAECGAPWERVVERGASSWEARKASGHPTRYGSEGGGQHQGRGAIATERKLEGGLGFVAERTTTGWAPSCDCATDPAPAVVLDPFFGAGTVGLVARENGRDYLGIELSPEYAAMAEHRIANRGRKVEDVEALPGQAKLF